MGAEETQRWAIGREAKTGERVVLTCVVCGGKYRPAGGACIHLFPAEGVKVRYQSVCGQCNAEWRPGHTCIPQPTESDVRDLWEQGYWTHVMEDILDKLDYGPAVATPESWEAV